MQSEDIHAKHSHTFVRQIPHNESPWLTAWIRLIPCIPNPWKQQAGGIVLIRVFCDLKWTNKATRTNSHNSWRRTWNNNNNILLIKNTVRGNRKTQRRAPREQTTDDKYFICSSISFPFMSHGSRLVAHGAWFEVHGSWPRKKGEGPPKSGSPPALSSWPWVMRFEPCAPSLERWTMNLELWAISMNHQQLIIEGWKENNFN